MSAAVLGELLKLLRCMSMQSPIPIEIIGDFVFPIEVKANDVWVRASLQALCADPPNFVVSTGQCKHSAEHEA